MKRYFGSLSFYRKALMIGVPVMLQSLIQSLVSLVDNFMVAGLGDVKMSGVSVAGQMAMRKVGDRYEHVGQADFSRLRYMMICGCGFPNSQHNFEPAVAQFKLCFPCNHTIITIPESPMFNAPEAAVVTEPRLRLVRQAGKQYAETGEIDTALLTEIGSPMIPEEQYAAIVNGGM